MYMSNQLKTSFETEEIKPFADTLKKPIAAAALLGSLGAGLLLGGDQEHVRPPDPSAELITQATDILNQATGCYAFADQPMTTRRIETTDGRMQAIDIPIMDTSTHQPGSEKENWKDPATFSTVTLGPTDFQAGYSVRDGRPSSQMTPALVRAQTGTKPNSTVYSLELAVPSTRHGEEEVKVYYNASASVHNTMAPETDGVITAGRLCGVVGFTVNQDGSIANIHTVPSDKVGKLHVNRLQTYNKTQPQ
jgi:hypothetical protein